MNEYSGCPIFSDCPDTSETNRFCNIEYHKCPRYQDFDKYPINTEVEIINEHGQMIRMITKGLEVLN